MLVLSGFAISAQEEFNPRKDFLYNGTYFMPYSPYLTVNYGYGYNMKPNMGEQNWAVDYHNRLKYEHLHFNVGYFSSSDKFFKNASKIYRSAQRCHNFHVGAGTRYAILKHNFGVYAGLSLVSGRELLLSNTEYYHTRLGPGFYLQAHYHFKPIYDVGMGLNIYAAISEHFKILGLQFSIMFSADYKPPAKPKIYY
jgi:hypothetical protein